MKGLNVHRLFLVALVFGTSVCARATEGDTMQSMNSWVETHQDSEWSGGSELWLDPAGNDAETSDATLQVEADHIVYTWSFRGAPHTGELRWSDGGLSWKDSWHQPEFVPLTPVPAHGSLVAGAYSYPAGEGPDWHWRLKLSQRPDGTQRPRQRLPRRPTTISEHSYLP